MKILIFSSIIVSILFLPFVLEESWQASESLFYGSSSFEKLPSTISDEPSNFELKIRYTEGPYAITKLTPIFDVSPKDAKQYVQIKTESIDGLHRNDVGRIQGTVTVDPQITHEKIFVSVYFNGTDMYGNSYKSAWMDSATIDVKKQTHESSPELEKEKSTCLNPDSKKVPLYGCNDVVTVKIDSPLQQFKSRIPSQQVSCKEGLVLVIKTSNSHPMCVKPSTKSKLLQKGLAEMPIITEEGFVVSKSLFPPSPLRIEGLNQTQYVGQKIEFAIEYNGTKSHCSFYPSLHIENVEHKTVWESNYILELCDPDITPAHFEKEWQIGNSALGTPIINMTGFYTLFAEFENDIVQQDFWVKSHSDVKIIGLEDTYKVGDNVKFYVTVQGFGMIPCEDFTVSIKNDRGQTILDVPAYNHSCQIPVEPENYQFYFPQKNDSYALFVNQTGKYTISAHFGDDSLEKEFVVKENDQIK